MYELNICHLYPDLLDLNGSRGNVIALKKRAQWRGINVNISNITIGEKFDASEHDIIFIGDGQNFQLEIIQDDFLKEKGPEIQSGIENDRVFLCICKGFQLLGKGYKTDDGKEIEFLGALNLWTVAGKDRMTGDMVFECDFLKSETCDGKIVGFENHSDKTYLGSGVEPLGRVIKGNGNNGEDKSEGAIYRNVFCSYSHGSLLPKNPSLADHLLKLALKQKYKDFTALTRLDDYFEELAHNSMIERILGL